MLHNFLGDDGRWLHVRDACACQGALKAGQLAACLQQRSIAIYVSFLRCIWRVWSYFTSAFLFTDGWSKKTTLYNYTWRILYLLWKQILNFLLHIPSLPWPSAIQPRTIQEMLAYPFPCREWILIFMIPKIAQSPDLVRRIPRRGACPRGSWQMLSWASVIAHLTFDYFPDFSRVNDEPARWSKLYACLLDLFGPKAVYRVVG